MLTAKHTTDSLAFWGQKHEQALHRWSSGKPEVHMSKRPFLTFSFHLLMNTELIFVSGLFVKIFVTVKRPLTKIYMFSLTTLTLTVITVLYEQVKLLQ